MAGVDEAREALASHLECEPSEVIFTSGATEANNLAIKGLIQGLKGQQAGKLHAITTNIEHDSVLEPFVELEKEGIEVTHIPPEANGVVDPDRVANALREKTVLVSVMYVNNEVGTIQPVKEIGKLIAKHNEKRFRDWKKLGTGERGDKPRTVYFHTDATQALNYLDCGLKSNHIDLLSLSGHKIYGPKGVGALAAREYVPLKPLQSGGHQEGNMRSGTLNVPGIVGLGAAVGLLTGDNISRESQKIRALRDDLRDQLQAQIPELVVNTDPKLSTPSHLHISLPGFNSQATLISLDQNGLAVSVGSACSSGSYAASHVLGAMGLSPEVARGSLRITLGKFTTQEEINQAARIIAVTAKRQ
jgi:cysteine desulfurase